MNEGMRFRSRGDVSFFTYLPCTSAGLDTSFLVFLRDSILADDSRRRPSSLARAASLPPAAASRPEDPHTPRRRGAEVTSLAAPARRSAATPGEPMFLSAGFGVLFLDALLTLPVSEGLVCD